jgi:hypothetical protein
MYKDLKEGHVNSENNDKITAFDSLFTTNHMRICKVLMPHLSSRMQHFFALYIKLSELSYTYSYITGHSKGKVQYSFENDTVHGFESSASQSGESGFPADFMNICDELLPYFDEKEREKVNRLTKMLEQMKNIQEMMEMAELFKDMMPESEGGFDADTFSQILGMMQGTDT